MPINNLLCPAAFVLAKNIVIKGGKGVSIEFSFRGGERGQVQVSIMDFVRAVTMSVFTGMGVMVMVSRATESLVSQTEQDRFQRSCDDLTLRLHELRPIDELPKAISQPVRRTLLVTFAITFVVILCFQMLVFSPFIDTISPQQTNGVVLYILGASLLAVFAFGQRFADWVAAEGNFDRSVHRSVMFVVGLPALSWALFSLCTSLAGHAPHVSSLWLGWVAAIASLLLGAIAAGLLSLWWIVTFSVYTMWSIGGAVMICHGIVRAWERVMWRISMSVKGAVAASSAILGIVAGIIQLFCQVGLQCLPSR